jgi:ATP-binding cassette subfamily B protein/subfamily B ATP-binding cassette protein MsbA
MFRKGFLTTGEFVTFLLYFFSSMHHLTSIVSTLIELNVVKKQAYPLMELMREIPAVKEKENPVALAGTRGEMEFRNVSFGYTPDKLILKDFNLRVSPGERVAVTGMSGSGKSTLLRLFLRFYDPIEGEILLDGIPIRDLALDSLRSRIGIVFQETYLFGASVRENIRFGNPDATDEMVYEAAKAANAHAFIEELPQGYDTLVGERGVRLSGGQQQRIALARLFLKNPAIVLLDEATSAMDNQTEAEIRKALDAFLEGRTTLTIAHRLSTVKDYDRIIHMERGEIVESGRFDQLLGRKGRFHQLVYGGAGEER